VKKLYIYFKRINDVLITGEEFFITALFILLTAISFLQVICRYVLHISTPWAEELSRYLFITVTYIGSAIAVKQSSHIELDLMDLIYLKYLKLKSTSKLIKFILGINIIAVFLFCILMAYFVFDYLQRNISRGATSTAMEIPMAIPIAFIFLGFVLMVLHYIYRFLILFESKNN
jgi:TRAP-type C4-dicarboxylate transport system permease small subunit